MGNDLNARSKVCRDLVVLYCLNKKWQYSTQVRGILFMNTWARSKVLLTASHAGSSIQRPWTWMENLWGVDCRHQAKIITNVGWDCRCALCLSTPPSGRTGFSRNGVLQCQFSTLEGSRRYDLKTLQSAKCHANRKIYLASYMALWRPLIHGLQNEKSQLPLRACIGIVKAYTACRNMIPPYAIPWAFWIRLHGSRGWGMAIWRLVCYSML